MTADPEPLDILHARQMALGLVIEYSATMEYTLRNAFCSLVASKYAAVVAGGQSVNWLIEQCVALVDVHHDMSHEHREAIKTALRRCRAANERRNHLVHGVKTASRLPDGLLKTSKSKLRSYTSVVESWTPATIQEAASELLRADLDLIAAMMQAVDPQVMVIGDALAWEAHRRTEQA